MRLKREILQILAEKNNVGIRRIQQKISKIEEDLFGIPRDVAACILAYESGVPVKVIKKYFDEETIKNARDIYKSEKRESKRVIKEKTIIKLKSLKINLDKIFKEIKEPLLPPKIFEEAKKMAEYYPIFYIFENSIRNFILLIMERKYGKDWWDTKIKTNKYLRNVWKEVEKRKIAESENRYHGKRGAHEIYYTDIDDLRKIIDIFFPDIKPFLRKDKHWIDYMIETIKISRNIIAHHNPLSKEDFDRVKIAFRDWCKQLSLVKERLGVKK